MSEIVDLSATEDEITRYDASFGDVIMTAAKSFGSVYNTATGEGTSMDKTTHNRIPGASWLRRDQIRGLLTNSWPAQKAASAAPRHALKMGFKLAFQKDKAVERDIKAEFNALDGMGRLLEGLCAARAFGGATILTLVEDSFRTDKGEYDASRPLRDADGALLPGIKRLAGLYVIEGGREGPLRPANESEIPQWAFEEDEKQTLLEWRPGKNFAKPIWWVWNPNEEHSEDADSEKKPGAETGELVIHRDRLIFLDSGIYTDKQTKQSMGGWSLGIFDAAVGALLNFDSSQTATINILLDFFTTVAKVKGYKNMVLGGQVSALIARFKANAMAQSILHMNICDADDEDIIKNGAPVSGFAEMLDKVMDWAAGCLRMPRSILFNEAPKSGGKDEAGREVWEDDCESLREFEVLPAIYDIVDLLEHAKTRPANIRKYMVGFPPLKRPSLADEATAYRTFAHGDEINVKGGILHPKEARSRHLNVEGLGEMVVEGEEPPPIEEVQKRAELANPGKQREAGENTETKGKTPNSAAKR